MMELQMVQRALAAGMHVLQEKPIASSTADAMIAIQAYRNGLTGAGRHASGDADAGMEAAASISGSQSPQRPVWFFAENYR